MFSNKLSLFTLSLILLSGAFFTSCNGGESSSEENKEEVKINDIQEEDADFKAEKVKKIFYTIPSPIEMASLIQQSGESYDQSILNDVENVNRYSTAQKQALNLGIYGADLSYTSMFEQNQESIYYLSAVQKLSKDLGVAGAIEKDIYNRINDNRNNRDSLLRIVSDAYWSLNSYLKENGREEVSAIVIAGGWVEGLYLASQHLTEDNAALKQRIAEQKYSLKDLIALLESYENQEKLQEVVADLKEIQTIYDQVSIEKGDTETSEDESGTMVIGGKSSAEISNETLDAIVEKVTETRNNYIN
ncbi:hypothetical protein [Halocola ammonii]